jgi:hypothetical protein
MTARLPDLVEWLKIELNGLHDEIERASAVVGRREDASGRLERAHFGLRGHHLATAVHRRSEGDLHVRQRAGQAPSPLSMTSKDPERK